MMRWPPTGRAPIAAAACRHRRGWRSAVWMFIPPGFAKLPVSRYDELLEVASSACCAAPAGCRGPRRSTRSPAPAIRRAAARTSLLVDAARSRSTAATATLASAATQLVEPSACSARNVVVERGPPRPGPRAARRGTRRRCPGGPAGGSRRARRVSVRRGIDDDQRALGIVGDLLEHRRGRAGSRATATGSCRRTSRPRRARSRRSCGSAAGRTAGRRPRTRRSSPAPARSSV